MDWFFNGMAVAGGGISVLLLAVCVMIMFDRK